MKVIERGAGGAHALFQFSFRVASLYKVTVLGKYNHNKLYCTLILLVNIKNKIE